MLFLLAGIAEIGGGDLVWQWLLAADVARRRRTAYLSALTVIDQMRILTTMVLALGACAAAASIGAQSVAEHPEWEAVFDSAGARGTFAVQRVGETRVNVSDAARARRPYLPASTFKIPNSLIALELGVVRDENQRFPVTWSRSEIEDWNRAQTFRTALKYSVVPVYQIIARAVGEPRYREWLARLDYGNRDPGGGVDHFWLDGALRTSALDQVAFLTKLATLTLPLSERSQRIVHAMLVREANDCYTLHAKTGLVGVAAQSSLGPDERVGWYVGWVETDTERWVFALNIDVRVDSDAGKRAILAKQLLVRAGAIPRGGCVGWLRSAQPSSAIRGVHRR